MHPLYEQHRDRIISPVQIQNRRVPPGIMRRPSAALELKRNLEAVEIARDRLHQARRALRRAVRGNMHDMASKIEPSATAAPIVDMVRANKLGLVVIDGSSAMEGNGPTDGIQVPMETIIAGTNPLATDMVAASLMGFQPDEISAFTWAHRVGLRPRRLQEIETRGEPLDRVRREFERPVLVPWNPADAPLLG